MAEKVTDLVISKFSGSNHRQLKDNNTAHIQLQGGPFNNSREVETYQQKIAQRIEQWDLPPYYAQYLVANYGRQTDAILSRLAGFLEMSDSEIALTRAELQFCVEMELTATALDFFDRRTGRLYFNYPSIAPSMELVLQDMQRYLNWDDQRLVQEQQVLLKQLEQAANFEPSPPPVTTQKV